MTLELCHDMIIRRTAELFLRRNFTLLQYYRIHYLFVCPRKGQTSLNQSNLESYILIRNHTPPSQRSGFEIVPRGESYLWNEFRESEMIPPLGSLAYQDNMGRHQDQRLPPLASFHRLPGFIRNSIFHPTSINLQLS